MDKSFTTTPLLTTTTAYQSRSLRDSNTRHTLALQFPHPKWTFNTNGNRESNSHFITLPLVVLAVTQSSSCAMPIRKQWRIENY